MDDFIYKTITLGFIIDFRKLLFEALNEVRITMEICVASVALTLPHLNRLWKEIPSFCKRLFANWLIICQNIIIR